MPLRDRPTRALRPRWPAQFDIEGVPRDNSLRQQEKETRMKMEQSSQEVGIFDFNNPPRVAHVHREYPKLLYKAAATRSVADEEAEKKALKEGWQMKPTLKALVKPPKPPRVKPPAEDDEAEETAGA
jgi:hypothetical protein